MTIDQFQEQFSEAISGLAGSKLVKFKVAAAKSAGQSFDAIDAVQQVGAVSTVYPEPGSVEEPHVLITFA